MIRRRHLLLAAAQAMLPAAGDAGVQAFAADDFVESIGVNTHVSSGLYASRFAEVRKLLGASGIRHVRDELRPANDIPRWRGLYDSFGIRSHLLVSPATNSPAEMVLYLRDLGVARVSAIEGQNEGDSDWFRAQPQARPDWATATVAYQRAIHGVLRANYGADVLPLVSPSVIDWKPGDVRLIRDAAPYCDAVAIHSYVQHGEHPETSDDYAAISWYLRAMRDAFKPGAPAMATETGYCTAIRPRSSAVSEAAAGLYLPRLLLNNFASGVRRTFLYEFLNEGPDPNDGEQNYGLLRADLTPKPAYTAISRLIAALADRGPRFTPGRLDVSLEGADPAVRSLLFGKRDGGFILALWLAVPGWDPVTAKDIAVAPRAVDVTVARPLASAAAMVLNDGGGWSALGVGHGPWRVMARDQVTLLKLVPS